MKIGIDANWAIFDQSGIGKYTENLIKALLDVDTENQYVLFFDYFRDRDHRRQMIQKLIAKAKAPVKVVTNHNLSILKEFLLQFPRFSKYFYREPVDVMHFPFFSGVPAKVEVPAVVTIHDLTFLYYPEHRGAKTSNFYLKRTKLAIQTAQKIIAVSEATRQDLIKELGVLPEQIKTVPEGVTANFSPIIEERRLKAFLKQYRLEPQKYILSVGTLEPRKNLVRLVKAYSMLPNQIRANYKLVLIGSPGWRNSALSQTINDLNLKANVIMPGYFGHEDLPYFYNGAKVFVYPSLYEGFGLPPLEAMACSTPVVASNISSLPEVMGHAGLLINPLKEEEIAAAIKRILTNDRLAGLLAVKGLKQAKKFSWDKTAKETIKVYKEILRCRREKLN